MENLQELSALIAPVARKHGVKRVAVFGSVARGEAGPNSDVDLLIDASDRMSLLGLIGFRLDAEETLRRPVDVVTSRSSDKALLSRIRKDEVVIFES